MDKTSLEVELIYFSIIWTSLNLIKDKIVHPDAVEGMVYLPYFIESAKQHNIDRRYIEIIERGLLFSDMINMGLKKELLNEIKECQELAMQVYTEKSLPSLYSGKISWPSVVM